MSVQPDDRRPWPRARRRRPRGSPGRQRPGVPPRASPASRCRWTCPARSSGSSSTTTAVVALRAMTRGDLPTSVRRGGPPTRPPVVGRGRRRPTWSRSPRSTAERIDGMTPTRMWVVEVNGRSVGFCRTTASATTPSTPCSRPDPDAIGVDYAIGAESASAGGLGPGDAVGVDASAPHSRFPDATAYFAAPDHRNAASLRILRRSASPGRVVRRAAGRRLGRTPWSAAPSTSPRAWADTDRRAG